MTHVTGPSYAFEKARRLTRHYAFDVLPVTVRDSFPALGKVLAVDRPAFYFSALGNASNLLAEFAIERQVNDVRFEGPTNNDAEGYYQEVSCQAWGGCNQPELHDANAYWALQLWNHGGGLPWANPSGSGFVQLRQRLTDKTQWSLVSSPGDGVTPDQVVAFTVPATPPGEGHHIRLIYDPYNLILRAIVDGAVRATLSGPTAFPRTSADLGLGVAEQHHVSALLRTGVVTGGGSAVFLSLTALDVESLATATAGATLP